MLAESTVMAALPRSLSPSLRSLTPREATVELGQGEAGRHALDPACISLGDVVAEELSLDVDGTGEPL